MKTYSFALADLIPDFVIPECKYIESVDESPFTSHLFTTRGIRTPPTLKILLWIQGGTLEPQKVSKDNNA